MDHKFTLHRKGRSKGSYYRKDFIGDVLYYCFIYRDIHITFAKKGRKNTIINDSFAELMALRSFISFEQLSSYKKKISSLFSLETLKDFDDYSLEELYTFVVKIREEMLGKEQINTFCHLIAKESRLLDYANCLDQRSNIYSLCKDKENILIAITEPELFETMKLFFKEISPKKTYFITSDSGECGLPSKEDLLNLFENNDLRFIRLENGTFISKETIDTEKSALMIFGESGLLDARDLVIPCGVFCQPKGYHASAVAGQLGLNRAAAIYVPSGFNILPNVPVTKKSRLNYLILEKLSRDLGDQVYRLSANDLYARFPKYFFNVYETEVNVGNEASLDIEIPAKIESIEFDHFDLLRAKAIKEHLESFPNCKYYNKVFTEDTSGIKGKILVHGVRIKKSKGASVIPCGKSNPLRAKIRQMKPNGTGIVSNFLFFLTPKLATLYNNLRFDRPKEKAEVDAGHLDYLLEYRDGVRTETFPLFRKTCIALKEDGEFIFFNFRLGGGTVTLNNKAFSWQKSAVDPENSNTPICIYTPYCSLPDGNADRETYRKAVGENRINFVMIQDKITAIRDGDVLIPGMGVVISFERELGESLCKSLNLGKNENGYYDPDTIQAKIELDPPEGIDPSQWKTVKWAYGGGLSLILDEVGLCDGDHMDEWFEKDGWTSPLSRQTQESALHTLAKHPRTAIGTTKKGELVILVFSGRTAASDGADYSEMCIIARDLFPDIQYLMNVDGGGSAMLGMVKDGSFTELSLPSTSTGSTVGMVRPINTVLHIPLS